MLFINDFCAFTVGGTLTQYTDWKEWTNSEKGMVYATEPDYKDLIPPMQLRRMSKPIRLSIAAVKTILSQQDTPLTIGAINVGTALGLLSDSEAFLSQLVKQEEQMLAPTHFIQSTQNTIGGQIALLLKSTAPNMTFTQRGHSFEHALLDIDLMEESNDVFLLGGVDEMTPHYYVILNKLMWQYNRTAKDIDLGEGAAFFLMSKKRQSTTLCALTAYTTFMSKNVPEIVGKIKHYLLQNGVTDVAAYNWVVGAYEVNEWDLAYDQLKEELGIEELHTFKQYTSNYATVSAVGLSFAIKHQLQSGLKKTVFINNYLKYWTIMLLEG